jgi:hypothetical protein
VVAVEMKEGFGSRIHLRDKAKEIPDGLHIGSARKRNRG